MWVADRTRCEIDVGRRGVPDSCSQRERVEDWIGPPMRVWRFFEHPEVAYVRKALKW
jgi:hypothetical protein